MFFDCFCGFFSLAEMNERRSSLMTPAGVLLMRSGDDSDFQ
jgi:hypothetical protein